MKVCEPNSVVIMQRQGAVMSQRVEVVLSDEEQEVLERVQTRENLRNVASRTAAI